MSIHHKINDMIRFILNSQQENGGFPPIIGEKPTPITTAQVLYMVKAHGVPWSKTKAKKAINYLLEEQYSDGKWSEPNIPSGQIANTAWSITALLKYYDRKNLDSITRGIGWLRSKQEKSGGFPQSEAIGSPNTYATSYAMRALYDYDPEMPEVKKAMKWLRKAQNKDGGFGLFPGEDSEASKTAYVLHGLLDCALSLEDPLIKNAIDWLISNQKEDGSWSSWSGEPEGTAVTLYILLRVGIKGKVIEHGFDYLDKQWKNGFLLDGHPCVWITIFAAQAYFIRKTLT